MTDRCDDGRVTRQLPELVDGGLQTPDQDSFLLVTDPIARYERTARAEIAVHAAICEGLAMYVRSLAYAIDGRLIEFSRVVADYPDRDDGSIPPPSGAVWSDEDGKYLTTSGTSPSIPARLDGDPAHPGRTVTITCSGIYELEALRLDTVCSDKEQRRGVRAMLERAFWPVEWMSGFKLVLPRYHNAIVQYLLVGGQQADSQDQAAAGLWPLTMRFRASCPVYRVESRPLARVTAVGTIGPERI